MLLILFCLFLLTSYNNSVFSHAHLAPRTCRPDPSEPQSSSVAWNQRLANQIRQLSSIVHNVTLSVNSSGTDILPQMTTQMNYSSIELQNPPDSLTVPGWGEKICGSRTQNVGYYGDNDLKENLFDFSKYCVLWNSSCPGNESSALGTYRSMSSLMNRTSGRLTKSNPMISTILTT